MASGLSGGNFAWRAGWRVAVFLLLMFGVPLALYTLDRLAGNDDVSLAEAIRLTTGTIVGSFLYLLFALALVFPCLQRVAMLGLPRLLGLLVPLLILLDFPFFVAGDAPTPFGSSIGWPSGTVPIYLITAFGLIAAMALAHPILLPLRPVQRWLGAAALGIAFVVVLEFGFLVGIASWMASIVANLPDDEAPPAAFVPLLIASGWVPWSTPLLCVALLGLATWWGVASRRMERPAV